MQVLVSFEPLQTLVLISFIKWQNTARTTTLGKTPCTSGNATCSQCFVNLEFMIKLKTVNKRLNQDISRHSV